MEGQTEPAMLPSYLKDQGELIKFKNARANEIKYLDLRSNSASTLTPVTLEATVAAGNHDNQINHCEVHDRGGSFLLPLKLLSATSTGAGVNYNNIIASNNFYNFKNFALDLSLAKTGIFQTTAFMQPLLWTEQILLVLSTTLQKIQHKACSPITSLAVLHQTVEAILLTWNSRTYFYGLNLYTNSSLVNNHFRKIKIQTNYTYSDIESHINLAWFGKPEFGALPV